MVITTVFKLFRKIIFTGSISVWLIMCVTILTTVTQIFHHISRRVAQMHRHVITGVLANICHHLIKRGINRVTFRGTSHIDDSLRNGQLTLRAA